MKIIRPVYISGPMTGLPEFNFPAFHAAEKQLRAVGFDVINPASLNPDPATSRYDCLRIDLQELTLCDAVALLPGWEGSAGARREVENALAMGCVVAPIDVFLTQ